jgi:hypothetical protein
MAPTDLPERANPPSPDAREDHPLNVPGMITGAAMMFLGFINIVVSISAGSEMAGVFTTIIYFAGLAVWAHSVIPNPTIRYSIMTFAVIMSLAFFHYGEVHFWHKQVIFWVTIVIVMFFMFRPLPSKPQ